MSGALCRHVARLQRLSPALRRELLQARCLHGPPGPPGQLASDPGEEEGKEGREGGSLPHQGAAFSPSSYRRPRPSSGASLSRAEPREEESNRPAPLAPPLRQQGNRPAPLAPPLRQQGSRPAPLALPLKQQGNCPAPLAPPLRQQGNRYSMSSSLRLSSVRSPLLDRAFSRTSHSAQEEAEPRRADVPYDSRAFQRCRPEYSSMTLDLLKRPLPIPSHQAFLLLHKVTALTGQMEPLVEPRDLAGPLVEPRDLAGPLVEPRHLAGPLVETRDLAGPLVEPRDLAGLLVELGPLVESRDLAGLLVELGRVPPDQAPLVRADKRFVALLRYAADNLRHFSPAQLLDALAAFVWLGLPAKHGVLGRYEAELAAHAAHMSLQQLLLAADLWRLLGRPAPRYLERMYERVGGLLSQVGVAEFVQLLYVVGEGRGCPRGLVQTVEKLLTRHVERLAPEEVGAVCLGLFKSKTQLSRDVVGRLVDRAWSQAADMSDFALVNIMKLLRFSHLDHRAWLEVTAREVPRRAPGMGVQGLMHVVLACSALHYRDDRILAAVAQRLPALAPRCRSKDAAKLLWAFGSLGAPPARYPELYPSLTDALRQREAEFQRYPEHFLTGLLGLAFVRQLPEDLLAVALSPEFVSLAAGAKHLELKKDLLTLDGVAELDFPGWAGPRLAPGLRDEATEMLWRFAQEVCQTAKVVGAELALRDLLGGEEFVSKRMILPHTRSIDLEVHLDPAGLPIPVTSVAGDLTSSLERSSSPSSSEGWERVDTGVTLTHDLLARLTNAKKTPYRRSAPSDPARPALRRTEPDEWAGPPGGVGGDLMDGLVGALTKPGNSRKPPREVTTPRAPAPAVKLAIQVSTRNHYCYRSQQLLGLHAMKRRHLARAGYRVVELPYWEWFPLVSRGHPEKLAYLHCKVFSCLD